MAKLVNGNWNTGDYVEFVKQYVKEHYMKTIRLGDLAIVAHVSYSYLSTRFKRETGCSFTEYLVRFRINKAKEILSKEKLSCREAAERVGYTDYAQFSKMFKKYSGITPSDFILNNMNTKKNKNDTLN